MKKLMTIIAMAGLVGCSSYSKKETVNNTQTPTTPTKATTPAKTEKKSDAKVTPTSKVTCTLKGNTRDLEVITDNEGCKTIYTKNGESSTSATGNANGEYCRSVMEKIKGNLVNAGYTCQ